MSPVDPAVRARAVLRSAARQAAHRTLISMNPWPLLGVGERDEALAAAARRHHRRPRAAAVLTIVYVAVDEQARTATLTVRWCTADGESGDVDLTGTDHVGPRARADVAEAIRSLLRDAGRTDASYWRIGGERP